MHLCRNKSSKVYGFILIQILINSGLCVFNFTSSASANAVYTGHVYIGVEGDSKLCQERITAGFRRYEFSSSYRGLNHHFKDHVRMSFEGFLTWKTKQSSSQFNFCCTDRAETQNTAKMRKETVEWPKEELWHKSMRRFGWLGGRNLIKFLSVRWGKPVRVMQCCWDMVPERGVNNTALKWDRPNRCLVTSILGQTKQTWPAFQKETGAGLMSTVQVSDFPKIR